MLDGFMTWLFIIYLLDAPLPTMGIEIESLNLASALGLVNIVSNQGRQCSVIIDKSVGYFVNNIKFQAQKNRGLWIAVFLFFEITIRFSGVPLALLIN